MDENTVDISVTSHATIANCINLARKVANSDKKTLMSDKELLASFIEANKTNVYTIMEYTLPNATLPKEAA